MPGKLCRVVVAQMAQQLGWEPVWAFDGRKNLYAPKRILPQVGAIWFHFSCG